MLHSNNDGTSKPLIPAKPPIAAKPRNIQKQNYVIIGSTDQSGQNVHSKNFKAESHSDGIPRKDGNIFALPISPPNIHDCINDCCGILNNKLECQLRLKNSQLDGRDLEENCKEENPENQNSPLNRKTPSSSLDSSSSSSGGFKDLEYMTKTKVVYEYYDKEDKIMKQNYQILEVDEPIQQASIGHSKIQEIQSKLLAQQQQQLQNHAKSDPIIISRHHTSHYQKSSKELEKLLGNRIEQRQKINQEKSLKRLSGSFDDSSDTNITPMSNQIANINISKQIQQKIQEEIKQQCEIIKEKFLIEKIPVQEHYNEFMVYTIHLKNNKLVALLVYLFYFLSISVVVVCLEFLFYISYF